MPTNVDDYVKTLPLERQKRIAELSVAAVAEEMTLRDLRRLSKLTQVEMAKVLGVSQDGVSRIESRPDMLVSTLRKAVAALDGKLIIIAEFKDRPTVTLVGIGEPLPVKKEKKAEKARSVATTARPAKKQLKTMTAR